MECCHEDGNASNNNVKNLRWDTRQSNINDKVKHGKTTKGKIHPKHGALHHNAKLTDAKVRKILRMFDTGNYTKRKLAYLLGIKEQQMGAIINGRAWKHITSY